MDKLDEQIIHLLSEDSRKSITDLSKALGVTRATVQERRRRLEANGVIQGYTIRFNPEYQQQQVSACIMIATSPGGLGQIVRQLREIDEIKSLQSISGQFDLMAIISCRSTHELDRQIDRIGEIEGIRQTMTSVILSSKFER